MTTNAPPSGGSRFAPIAPVSGNADKATTPAKLLLGSLDEPEITVQAQYNPKEIEVSRSVPWSKTNEANKANSKKEKEQGIHLEFTGADGRSLSLELLFDSFEEKVELKAKSNVAKQIENLEKLASVRKPGATTDELKRPHRCVLVWGNVFEPRFECVIESLSVKYTMFSPTGQPLRATANVKLKEANIVSTAKKKK